MCFFFFHSYVVTSSSRCDYAINIKTIIFCVLDVCIGVSMVSWFD
jgi:hypothetical protein